VQPVLHCDGATDVEALSTIARDVELYLCVSGIIFSRALLHCSLWLSFDHITTCGCCPGWKCMYHDDPIHSWKQQLSTVTHC
jgi:hypothetical protein